MSINKLKAKSITVYLKDQTIEDKVLIYHFTLVITIDIKSGFLEIDCQDQTHFVSLDSILRFTVKEF